MYFTIWYGVYRKSTRTLSYSGGGHPPPLLISRGSGNAGIAELDSPSAPIGIMTETEFPTVETTVPPGSSLFVYSDGAIEVFPTPGKLWGVAGLVEFMQGHDTTQAPCLDALQEIVIKYTGSDVLADDFSIFLAQFP